MDNLKILLDKTYITNILCELSYNYYNFINNCIMLPTILGSSILTIMNSADIKIMKIGVNPESILPDFGLVGCYGISLQLTRVIGISKIDFCNYLSILEKSFRD